MKDIKFFLKAIFSFLFLFSLSSNAQQVFISQDFEDPTFMDWSLNEVVPFLGTVSSTQNTFIVNDDYVGGQVQFDPFVFLQVPNTADQGYQPNSKYLHTAAFDAINSFPVVLNTSVKVPTFNGTNQELICVESPDYSTIGFEGVDVSYWWYSGASETQFGAELYYSLDFGTTWTLIDGPLFADFTWQLSYVDLGNTLDNQPNVRFAFVFNNGMDNPFDPDFLPVSGFGLDDFKLIADCEFSLTDDYTVCSGESTTIFADTTLFNNFQWNTGSTIDSTSLVITEDTNIVVFATNDYCTVVDTVFISVQTERADLGLIVNGEVNGIGIPCHGDCNGELLLEVINGSPNADGSYNIQWLDSLMNPINNNVVNDVLNNFTSSLSNVCEGKYYVEVKDAICNIPEIDSINIYSNEPILNAFVSDSVSCYNGSDGTALAIPSGGIAPYTFNWGEYGILNNISSLPIGSYTVVITDSVSCSEDFTIEINQPNQLIADAFISDEISCYGESDGELSCNVYGGTGSYSFVWSHPNYPWVDDSPYHLQSLSNLPFSVGADDIALNPDYQSYSDPYKITITDENGCESESEIYLIEPPKLELFLTQPTKPAYCNNNLLGSNTGWAQVSASGGSPNSADNYNFVWSVLGQTDEDVLYSSIENMNSGTYDVTVVDSRLCADQLSLDIDLVATWQAYTSTTPASCFGYNDGTVSISMEGGCGDVDNSCDFEYQWNGGASTGNNLADVDELQQGVYSVTVSDEFGCEGVYTLTVGGPTRVDFQISDLTNQSCYSPTASSDDGSVVVEVEGGVSPYTVNWTDMNTMITDNSVTASALTINGLTSSNWQIQISDASGCEGVFDLSSLHTNPFFIDNGIEVTSEINTDDLFLTDTINCYGASNAIGSVLNSNPLFDYSWHLESSTNIIDEGTSTDDLPAGNVQVTASYLLGLCKATSPSVSIVERAPFTLTNNSTEPQCNDDSNGIINVSVTGATPYLNNDQLADYNFSWFPASLSGLGTVNENGSLDFNITNLNAGTYYLEVVDRYGCDTVFSLDLVNPLAILSDITTTNLSCHNSNGAADGSIDIIASGGTTPYSSYHISATNSNNTGTFNNLSAGNYSVYVEDVNGCTSISTPIILSEPAPLLIDIVSSIGIDCDGANTGGITVLANGGTQPYASYTLTGASISNNNTGIFTNLQSGNYTIGVVDAENCIKTIDQVLASPPPFLTPILSATDPSCNNSEDGSIDLTISGGTTPYTFDWSNGENSEDIGFLSSGTYNVTITDENGCDITASQTLNNPSEVIADWVINTPGADGPHSLVSKPAPFTVEFEDISQNSDLILNQWWIDGQNMTSNFYEGFALNSYQYTFTEIGDYEVVMEVFDSLNQCSDTISLIVSVQGINEFNAFSPNGDNVNDNFFFESFGISELNAIFYNRWGDKIYEMTSPSDIWDGVSMNGLEVPEGVYFYVLNATGEDGSPYTEKGSVTIYR